MIYWSIIKIITRTKCQEKHNYQKMMDDFFTSDNITINLQIELPKKCHVQQSYYYFMVKKTTSK